MTRTDWPARPVIDPVSGDDAIAMAECIGQAKICRQVVTSEPTLANPKARTDRHLNNTKPKPLPL